ncbi:MAG: alpha-L-fucosidase, partial [Phycisphaerales bacterium]
MQLWLVRLILFAILISGSPTVSGQQEDSASKRSSPMNERADRAALQQEFVKLRFGLFLHFNMATYVDREWANGYEDPALFKPDKLDCRQWADLASAAGMRYAVLTVKHTGGWCLWDSKHTAHDIAGFVNYKNGKGDIALEFVDAFRARGLKVGFYYCFPGNFSDP